MKKIIEIIKKKWLRETSLTIILVAIIVGAFIGLNLWVKKLDFTDIDFTKEKLYSLSDESKKQVSGINEKINILLFGFEEGSNVADISKQYSKVNENISVEIINISERTDLASKYNVQDGNNKIVIEAGEKNIELSAEDLYDMDYTTYEYIDITEQKLTNAILTLSMKNVTKVYFLTGHGEYEMDLHLATFSKKLQNEVYDIANLNLLINNEVPADCAVLVISSPEKDFTDYETELITNYINNGGKILWLNDPYSHEGTLTNVQKILDLYGVELPNEGIVFEQDTSKMLVQTPYMILPTIKYTEITGDLADKGTVLLINSGIMKLKSTEELENMGITAETILQSSDKAFYRTNLKIQSYKATAEDQVETNILGALIKKKVNDEKTSELVIYSDNLFAADFPITIQSQQVSAAYFYNNMDLVINSVSYLADRKDAITIRKSINKIDYTPKDNEDTIVRSIIFGVPVIIIIAGIVVWQVRRRKK